jgi:hypothetical protein
VKVTADHVARVVAEVSSGSEDPQRVASLVGAFMQEQPMIGHYLSSFSNELGLEGVVLVLLHAHVLARCVEIAGGRRLRVVQAADLDLAARAARAALAADEPDLDGYLEGNLPAGDATLGDHRDTALGALRVVARALVDQP